MEDKRTIEEILEMLDESIKSGLYFEIRADDSATLKEYMDAKDKQIGIANTVNQMKQNNISALRDNLEIAERKIENLTERLNKTKIKQLEDEEKSLDLQLTNKKYQIERYVKAIERIEDEINELNDQLNIIY